MRKLWTKFTNTDFYKTFKEEMVVVPLAIICFYLFNSLLLFLFPHSAFFDFFSVIETLVSKIVTFIVALWVAHLSLRVSFPKVYKFLHDDFYHDFDSIPKDKKIEYAIKFILIFIIAAALIFKGL